MKQILKGEWKQLLLYWAFTSVGSYIVSLYKRFDISFLQCVIICAISIAGAILLTWIISLFIDIFIDN